MNLSDAYDASSEVRKSIAKLFENQYPGEKFEDESYEYRFEEFGDDPAVAKLKKELFKQQHGCSPEEKAFDMELHQWFESKKKGGGVREHALERILGEDPSFEYELREVKKEMYAEKHGEEVEVPLDCFDDVECDGFEDEIYQFAESGVVKVKDHENADGYVTVISSYKDIAFQASCVESDESPWFDSLDEAESRITQQGVW